MDIAEYHEIQIVGGAEGAEYFRSQKAEGYPDDDRNKRSTEALSRLADNLRNVPLSNPLLMECYKLEIEQWDGPDDALWHSVYEELALRRGRLFGRYGFDAPEDSEPKAFLESYRDVLLASCKHAFGQVF